MIKSLSIYIHSIVYLSFGLSMQHKMTKSINLWNNFWHENLLPQNIYMYQCVLSQQHENDYDANKRNGHERVYSLAVVLLINGTEPAINLSHTRRQVLEIIDQNNMSVLHLFSRWLDQYMYNTYMCHHESAFPITYDERYLWHVYENRNAIRVIKENLCFLNFRENRYISISATSDVFNFLFLFLQSSCILYVNTYIPTE